MGGEGLRKKKGNRNKNKIKEGTELTERNGREKEEKERKERNPRKRKLGNKKRGKEFLKKRQHFKNLPIISCHANYVKRLHMHA